MLVLQVGDKQGGGSRVLVQWSGVKRGHVVLLDGRWKAAVDGACQSRQEHNGWEEELKDLATAFLWQDAELEKSETVSWWVIVLPSDCSCGLFAVTKA